jgi:hypothetical protein
MSGLVFPSIQHRQQIGSLVPGAPLPDAGRCPVDRDLALA